jgi:uncharacterized protein
VFQRHLRAELEAVARKMPAVTLVGPRQSGKTTLARAVFPDHAYVSLERPDQRGRALEDPLGFLAGFAGRGVILDEVQKAPTLLSYLQDAIDRDPQAGRFVLTGSQNLLLMERVSQTLAGRTAILRLLPLALSELCDRPPLDPEALADTPADSEAPPPPGRDLWETVWAGLYPRIHADGLDPSRWLADYHQSYVERDLRDALRVMDLDLFDRFLRLTAARTGQELKLSDLAADVGITIPTAKQWITALRIGFVVMLVPPHHQSFRKRLRKHPKLHFLDTGLACHLLGIPDARTLRNHPLCGAIFESFVASELAKAYENRGKSAPLFFWRDAGGHELDLLLDQGTRLLPVEVKSGATVPSTAVDGLRWWTGLRGNPNRAGVLVHGGSAAFGLHGFAVRPWYLA